MLSLKLKYRILVVIIFSLILSGATVTDCDGDGIANEIDNCMGDFTGSGGNADQRDFDGDGKGDVCDLDADNDGIVETDDCPFSLNESFSGWRSNLRDDNDSDGCHDKLEDDDKDNDGIPNDIDNCPDINNKDQRDTDNDGIGEVCDNDKDNDGVTNDVDNCFQIPNPDQRNFDGDPFGDLCDDDDDGDTVRDRKDLCPLGQKNWPSNKNSDNDLDGCRDRDEDDDDDNDTVVDTLDNCPLIENPAQEDDNGDGIGNACEIPVDIIGGDDGESGFFDDEVDSCAYELPTTCDPSVGLNIALCFLEQQEMGSCTDCSQNQSECRERALSQAFNGCGPSIDRRRLSNVPGCDKGANLLNRSIALNPDLKIIMQKEQPKPLIPDSYDLCLPDELIYCESKGGDSVCGCKLGPQGSRHLYVNSTTPTSSTICVSDDKLETCSCSQQVNPRISNTGSLICGGDKITYMTGSSVLFMKDTPDFSLCYNLKLAELQLEDPEAELSRSDFNVDTNNNQIPDMCELFTDASEIENLSGCTMNSACNYDATAIYDDNSCTFPTPWFQDNDGDGYGNVMAMQVACDQPVGYVQAGGDDDDADSTSCDVDSDSDTCDDCSQGAGANASNDGTDTDGDGTCDDGDTDNDGDGVVDSSDDCSEGTIGWTSSVVTDYDGDGCQDSGEDTDDDNDGITDASDSCAKGETGWTSAAATDYDGDGCQDASEDTDDDGDGIADGSDSCSTGTTGWTSAPVSDYDGDGCQDSGEDTDDDNDGAYDDNDSDDNDATVCSDVDNDTCDDCTNGSYDLNNDGDDEDGDGICDDGDSSLDCAGVDGGSAVIGNCGACYEDIEDGTTPLDSSSFTDIADILAYDSIGADLDKDGDYDVVTFNDTDVYYYINNGSGGFGVAQQMNTSSLSNMGSIVAADLDMNGEMDILVTVGGDSDKITWFRNDGLYVFTEIDINLSDDDPSKLIVVDLDLDGYFDLVTLSTEDDKLSWHKNDGSQSFSSTTIKDDGDLTNPSALDVGDIDNDGYIDIVVGYESTTDLLLFKNDENQSFSESSIISVDEIQGVKLFDADADNDLDIAVVSYNSSLYYIETIVGASVSFSSSVIDNDINSPLSLALGDLDGDDNKDILVSAVEFVSWYKHDGNMSSPDFSSQTSVFHSGGDPYDFNSINVHDFDNDTDLDILTSATSESKFYWIENDLIDCKASCTNYNSYYEDVDGDDDGYYPYYIYECLAPIDDAPTGYSKNKNDNDPTCASPSTRDCTRSCGGSGEDDDDSCGICWSYQSGTIMDGITGTDISTSHNSISPISIDLDDDQDFDLLSYDSGTEIISYYLNDGSGSFDSAVNLATSITDLVFMKAKDLDSDGDVDVIYTSGSADGLYWLRNDGSYSFTAVPINEGGCPGPTCHDNPGAFAVEDINGDGDEDIVLTSLENDAVKLFENNGSETFVQRNIGLGGDINPRDVDVADLDGDGDKDIVVAYEKTHGFIWLENDGSQNFTPNTIDDYIGVSGAYGVAVADFDGDGDIDVAASYAGDEVSWYENRGESDPTWAKNSLSTGNVDPLSAEVGDFNNDGYIDILTSGGYALRWFQNNGASDPSFTEITILFDGSAKNILSSHGVDLDNDGDLDVLASINSDTSLTWFKNDYRDCLADCSSIELFYGDSDSDGDGDPLDFLYDCVDGAGAPTGYSTNSDDADPSCATTRDCSEECGGSDISCYDCDGEQNGSDTYSVSTSATEITTDATGVYTLYAADIDDDGALEVVVAEYSDNTVVWYESNGTANVLGTSVDGVKDAYPIDLDEDGDMDFVTISETNNKLYWFDNDGSQNFTLLEIHDVTDPTSVYPIDVNGDGPIDILVTSGSTNTVFWYENNGSESFDEQTVYAGGAIDNPVQVVAGDLDDDDDIDVIVASQDDNRLSWYENDGSETFGAASMTSIYASATGVRSLSLYDLDVDGDLDFVASEYGTNQVGFYINSQMPGTTFIRNQVNAGGCLGPCFNGPIGVHATDFDGDGDGDLAIASFGNDSIYWFQNTATSGQPPNYNTITEITTSASGGPRAIHAADFDNDGQVDIIVGAETDGDIDLYSGSCSE